MPIYTFNDLLQLWRQGRLTLDEIIEPMLRAMIAFKNRTTKLDYKLLPLTSVDEVDVMDDDPYIDPETLELLDVLPQDQTVAYKAVDHVLERFALMELKLLKMERDYDEIAREIDTTTSHLN